MKAGTTVLVATKHGPRQATLTRDWHPHTIAYALLDGEELPFLPECVQPMLKPQEQQAASLRDAWRAK